MSEISVLFLGYYHRRYLDVLRHWAGVLRRLGYNVKEMYSDDYYKDSVLAEFGNKHELIVYFGHGTPGAWSAYRRITLEDFRRVHGPEQARVLLSFSCYSLGSVNERNLAQEFVDQSLASCVLGYPGRVRYEDNLKCFTRVMSAVSAAQERDYKSLVKAIVGQDILPAQVIMPCAPPNPPLVGWDGVPPHIFSA